AEDEDPQRRGKAARRDRVGQDRPRDRVARPPPRDQVIQPQAPLRGEGRREPCAKGADPAPAPVPVGPPRWPESSVAFPPIAATSASSSRRRAGAALARG